jgi:flagellar protein FliO/FliZ
LLSLSRPTECWKQLRKQWVDWSMSTVAVMLSEGQDKLNELLGNPTPTQAAQDTASYFEQSSVSGGFWQLIGLVFLLIIILIAAYYTSRYIAGLKMGQLKKSNFQVIDSYRISATKVLQIIKVGNRYLLLAIGKDTISLLTELDEAEVMLREFPQVERLSFKQILDKFKNNNE